jgi:hypothetical protein
MHVQNAGGKALLANPYILTKLRRAPEILLDLGALLRGNIVILQQRACPDRVGTHHRLYLHDLRPAAHLLILDTLD